MGKSGCFPRESLLRQSRATQPTVHNGCFSVSIIHRALTWTRGSLTSAQTGVYMVCACHCTQVCTWCVHAIAHRCVYGVCMPLHTGVCMVCACHCTQVCAWCVHAIAHRCVQGMCMPLHTGVYMVCACNCTQVCTDTVRESALIVDSGRKIPCHIEESSLRQRRAGPTLYQLSYIAAPTWHYELDK